MPQKQTAIVVVSKDWIDTSVRYLINRGRESRSTGETHLVYADLEDANDHRGLWLKNIKATSLTTDQSEIVMRFMIPWNFVLALGVVDHGTELEPGFAGAVAAESADLTDQASRMSKEQT